MIIKQEHTSVISPISIVTFSPFKVLGKPRTLKGTISIREIFVINGKTVRDYIYTVKDK